MKYIPDFNSKFRILTQNELKQLNLNLEKKVEEEREKRLRFEKELTHKSRLESMGEMIDNIAHQWRQPLMNMNAILMNIDRAHELGELDADCLESYIQEATNLTTHMSQTIEDFRNFFCEDKEIEMVDVNEIIIYSFTLLKSATKEVVICFDRVESASLLVYKNELIQVLLSIIGNAIYILKQRNIQDKKIFISLQEHTESIEIFIEDNGGGIGLEHIHSIFEPYYSTKHQDTRSGIGLYICKIIIEDHMRGTIKVSNTELGAKFSIHLKKEWL